MLMYHKLTEVTVEVHRSKVASMENRGWTTEPPEPEPPEPEPPKPPTTEKEE